MKDLFKNNERNNALRAARLSAFISGVMTDDERAELWGLPAGCRMRENAKIIEPENFQCGEYVWIGEGAVLDASGGLEIGAHTSVGLNVMIWSHTSFLANLEMDNGVGSPLIARAPTRIGSGCFIAGPTVVYHGVSVGDRVVVMPMSVINKDIPSNSLVGGSPARVIRTIDDAFIEEQKAKFREAGMMAEADSGD